ncbi:DNA mismatch repair protein-MLH1 family [Phaffia rhodozyma]|uniref:DNA mismatch repair protein-MLH1 family n=1 Tax=Phaffia rhodozyma TaxID=264483 RepID=A0A0F7SVS6_PHARH|nr:DNA mismatch repair protein-MLH1 family [Phaffia rhodozyma]
MESEQDTPFEPKPIVALDEIVINRIAAGEIIQRPANALKELIENCLDAGAKSIRVSVKDGGLKLLQIQDDGCGIRHADLPILCQRFTTSKLRTFSDLETIATYGFRGEALASISHVAHVSVLTKTKEGNCAWKANYSDGVLIPLRPGESPEPKSAAGNQGTTIIVEDLFFNVPTRRKALKSTSDEFSRILDVVTKYSIHNPSVSFMCKKAGQAAPVLSTPCLSTSAQTIRIVHGPTLAKELLHLPKTKNTQFEFEFEGWLTGANWNTKRSGGFLVFINHRLVDCPRLKKAVEALYSVILPKGTYPWVYIDLLIKPENVDVNVHPTKSEVHFLNEEEIIEAVCETVQEVLIGANSSRTYSTQPQNTVQQGSDPHHDSDPEFEEEEPREVKNLPTFGTNSGTYGGSKPSSTRIVSRSSTQQSNPAHKVRVDPTVRTLDSMFAPLNSKISTIVPPESAPIKRRRIDERVESEEGDEDENKSKANIEDDADMSEDEVEWVNEEVNTRTIDETKQKSNRERGISGGGLVRTSECRLTSIVRLRNLVKEKRHNLVSEIIKDHKFVGIVSCERTQSLIQHNTKLYLVNHAAIADELFYQLGLCQFGEIGKIRLDPPAEIKPLLKLAIVLEEDVPEERREATIQMIEQRLIERREMLDEYFSLTITEDGRIESIPLLLEGYTPDLNRLPEFLMRLGPGVDWSDEEACFESFLRELAYFYIPLPLLPSDETDATRDKERELESFQIEHVIFPALRRHLRPSKSLLKGGHITQVANLPDLYKVFESDLL